MHFAKLTWFLAVLAFPSLLWADGMMAPRIIRGGATTLASSPKQEALIIHDGKTVQVALRTHFRAGPEELAWIVPVPAKPANIDKGDDAIFARLAQDTAPRFDFYEMVGGHFGCGCGAMEGAPQRTLGEGRLVVVSAGSAGVFQYVVLSAAQPAELAKWLEDNGYAVPVGTARVLEPYTKAGWHFLAMRIRPEEAKDPTLAPHPICYSYEDTKIIYPMTISQLSADLENEVVLYVAGTQRYACANWVNGKIDDWKLRAAPSTPSKTNYEEQFRTACQAKDHIFITELARITPLADLPLPVPQPSQFAGGTPYLTRLRTIMPARAMDRDVVFMPVTDWGDVDNHFQVYGSAGSDRSAAAVTLPWAAILALAAVARLWPSSWRRKAPILSRSSTAPSPPC